MKIGNSCLLAPVFLVKKESVLGAKSSKQRAVAHLRRPAGAIVGVGGRTSEVRAHDGQQGLPSRRYTAHARGQEWRQAQAGLSTDEPQQCPTAKNISGSKVM